MIFAKQFIKKVFKQYKHKTIMEFADATFRIICDRGIGNEIVRSRIASYAQESTRYVNYNKKAMEFISLDGFKNLTIDQLLVWENACKQSQDNYKKMISLGASPQLARNVLTLSLKTEIVVKMNFRMWENFFSLRCDHKAHPQMVLVANMIKDLLNNNTNNFFD